MAFGDEEVLRLFSRYSDAMNESFTPDKMKVRLSDTATREGKQRIILLSKDRLQYRVLQINKTDSPARRKREEDIAMG